MIRLVKNPWYILLCPVSLIKTFEICPPSNEPGFLLFRTDAVHGCPKGLADYNLNFILLFSLANVYHYPPLVIMAESQPRLCFKYKGSLGAEADAAWRETDSLCQFPGFGKFCLLSCSICLRPSWRLSCHASTCGNVPVMLVCNCQCTAERFSPFF